MRLGANLRKAVLTVHVTCSLGWVGAAAAYLVLGVVAATSDEPLSIRACWIAMDLIGWYAVAPAAIASLITGIGISVITPWGLFRHYWVVIALVLTSFATVILLLHLPGVTATAERARTADDAVLQGLGGDVLHPALGLVVLLVVAVLNMYKPRGLTPHGLRRQRRRRPADSRVLPVQRPEAAEAKAVGDHEHRGEGHGGSGQHRVEQAGGGER